MNQHRAHDTIRANAARLLAATAPAWGLPAAAPGRCSSACAACACPKPGRSDDGASLAAFDWVI
jgi:hypothetical protein